MRPLDLPRPVVLALVSTLVLAACGGGGATPSPSGDSGPTPVPTRAGASPSASVPASASASPAPSPSGTGGEPPTLAVREVVSGLDAPVDIATRPGDTATTFVLEQTGRIRIVRDGALLETPFLDITELVQSGGEQGLLGLAVHPDPADGRVVVYYTDLDRQQVVATYRTSADDPDRADPDSATTILRMADEYGNHNGGALAFGPDGFLYIATGDGGGGGDPLGSGRSLDTLLAKVLRIDIDVDPGAAEPYAIPDGNPFVGQGEARPEIWVTGLRNPWRMRFDPATGDLWIGDVGQGAWEEIDHVPAGASGLDFGWNETEGFHCYGGPVCDQEGLTAPIAEYGHDEGCSVTGGTVYRGSAFPALAGWYVFSDYCSGRFWVLDAAGAADGSQQTPAAVLDSGRNISAIAAGPDGELYATDLGGSLLAIEVAGG